jgi:hypothetical protein
LKFQYIIRSLRRHHLQFQLVHALTISNYSPGSYVAQGSITELTATPVEIGPDAGTTGDSATMIINSTSSNFCYRITAMVGNNLLNNFISIEQIQ